MINTRGLVQSVCGASIILAAGISGALAQQTVAPASNTPVSGAYAGSAAKIHAGYR